MGFAERLRRLEGGSGCHECGDEPRRLVPVYPGEDEPADERCPGCGRERHIILTVVYDGPAPGEEASK